MCIEVTGGTCAYARSSKSLSSSLHFSVAPLFLSFSLSISPRFRRLLFQRTTPHRRSFFTSVPFLFLLSHVHIAHTHKSNATSPITRISSISLPGGHCRLNQKNRIPFRNWFETLNATQSSSPSARVHRSAHKQNTTGTRYVTHKESVHTHHTVAQNEPTRVYYEFLCVAGLKRGAAHATIYVESDFLFLRPFLRPVNSQLRVTHAPALLSVMLMRRRFATY